MNTPTKEELHGAAVNEEFIGYEVINKDTGEVIPVKNIEFGDEEVEAITEVGTILFKNTDREGNLENDTYAIRQISTGLTPNNDGVVTDEGTEINPE